MSEPRPIPDAWLHRVLRLPNGYDVVYQSKAEARYFFHDIWEKRVYLRHGVTLEDGDCVFDVGANIGTFTLFVHGLGRTVDSYSFEPAPRLFEILRINASRYAPRARLFNFGISDRAAEAEFTFYPNSPGMSTFHPSPEEERGVLRAILANQAEQEGERLEGVMRHADDLLEERFRAETFRCRLRPLSEVIYAQRVERIDLLKVDVQKSELQVLEGLEPRDWERVRQVVLEVHDTDGGLARATALLEGHGFQVVAEQDDMYVGSPLFNLYARRPAARERAAGGALERARERARQLRAARQGH